VGEEEKYKSRFPKWEVAFLSAPGMGDNLAV
jgi:hypothetical protein